MTVLGCPAGGSGVGSHGLPCDGSHRRGAFAAGEIIWLSAGAAAGLTLCICRFLQPYGRGWKPALWAFGIMLIPVVLIVLSRAGGGE